MSVSIKTSKKELLKVKQDLTNHINNLQGTLMEHEDMFDDLLTNKLSIITNVDDATFCKIKAIYCLNFKLEKLNEELHEVLSGKNAGV